MPQDNECAGTSTSGRPTGLCTHRVILSAGTQNRDTTAHGLHQYKIIGSPAPHFAGTSLFRVGNEERQWELGKAWAFDDTIEHEARNDADETRIILIFDVWNPLLSDAEKEKVRVLLSAQRAWLNEEMTS